MRRILLSAAVGLVLLAAAAGWATLAPLAPGREHAYVCIDADDTRDSVLAKLRPHCGAAQLWGVRLSALVLGYGPQVRTGRYEVGAGESALRLVQRLRTGRQAPVRLTWGSLRTMDQLAARLGRQLMTDSATWARCFADTTYCAAVGCTPPTLPALFLPNTYEVFWDVTPQELAQRMVRESAAFWTDERLTLAQSQGLTPVEVATLASIVDQETAAQAEKPRIAGMYLNRLRTGMKLQADPTVKFALRRFELRRILREHLSVRSPYNTYLQAGLPPGPIALPTQEGIEAVLHAERHDYLFMCANADFSGTHCFAATYAEHLQNARRYARALDERGIH